MAKTVIVPKRIFECLANKQDDQGHTAFHLAAHNGHAGVIRIFLSWPRFTWVGCSSRADPACPIPAVDVAIVVPKIFRTSTHIRSMSSFNVSSLRTLTPESGLGFPEFVNRAL